MSTNACTIWLVAMWIFAAVLFSGEPDVMDMLVARGMPPLSTTHNPEEK